MDAKLAALIATVDEYEQVVGAGYDDWVPGEDVDADSLAWGVVSAAMDYVHSR